MRIRVLCLVMVLASAGSAFAAPDEADPNIDPVLPDPKPNHAYYPPSTATQGVADPGPSLEATPVSNATLMGHGPGCSTLSPGAVDSPPADHVTPAWQAEHPAPGKHVKPADASAAPH